MKLKLFDDLKHLSNIVAETAAARLALSQALTGRVVADPMANLSETLIREAIDQALTNRRKNDGNNN